MIAKSLLTLIAGAAGLALPATAAASSTSSNWAGYVAHQPGLRYRSISASWVQPTATCTAGERTYSAYWVGLGGYSTSSRALEQVGTEADCDADGRASYDAWYELVPASQVTTHMRIHAGDRMSASVRVSGHTVRIRIADTTRRTSISRRLHARVVDLSSADWIVEAPALCNERGNCQTQALADFGTVQFAHARATTTHGRAGAALDSAWRTTRIDLVPDARGFGPGRFAGQVSTAGATTAGLSTTGTSFVVTYSAGGSTTVPADPQVPADPGVGDQNFASTTVGARR